MGKNVLFVNPPTGLYVRDDRCQSSVEDFLVAIPRPPHELLIMATVLHDAGHQVLVRDYPIHKGSFDDYKNDLVSFQPDVVVINATIPSLSRDAQCARMAKEMQANITVILRCGMIEHIAKEVMQSEQEIDIICYGETDETLVDFLAAPEKNGVKGIYYRSNADILKTEARPVVSDLDALPIVNRDFIDSRAYIRPDSGRPLGLIEVSRGCPYSCIFCLTPSTYGHAHRRRSPKNIVREIRICVEKYGIRDFHFKSDLFSCNHAWVHELCDEIIAQNLKIAWFANSRVDSIDEALVRHMKESGCFAISFGVESGSQEILDKMNKKITTQKIIDAFALCKRYRIETYAYFIIGFPWDTEETINESVAVCKKIDPDFVDFFFPYVFYGTELYEVCRTLQLLEPVTYADLQKQSYVAVQCPTLTLSKEQLVVLRRNAMRAFYLRVRYGVKVILRCKSFAQFVTTVRFGLASLWKLLR